VRPAGLVVLAWLAVVGTASAQEPALVLRPAQDLRRVAERVQRVLSQRIGVPVEVGQPPPPEVIEAVPVDHVAMVLAEGFVRLVIGASQGRSFATDLELRRPSSEASVRAIALAIESLLDAARQAPGITPPEQLASGLVEEEGEIRTRWRMIRPFEGRAHPWRTPERPPLAKPTLFARFLAGVSGERGTPLFGVGLGLGLCVEDDCAVLEGDLPFTEQRGDASDGAFALYRFVAFSMRFQWRPEFARFGDFIPGATFGLVTRVGSIRLGREKISAARTETDLGVRGTVEIAWRFFPRFELVLEVGLDAAIDRAEFIRPPRTGGPVETIFLEDRFTPWGMFSFRLRP
jgi:hypothetical protein